jgi:5-methylcytosine-specific restriction endonuclease McrA
VVRDTYRKDTGEWAIIRQQVLHRDQYRCRGQGCGKSVVGDPTRAVHHILELSRGGRTVLGNLITLCHDCHEKRHSHMRMAR